tara:strand:+ start:221 stop:1087 length:867 start_codon:yes stop_codon:yes gene_type:complete
MEIISQNLTKFSTIRTKSFAKYFCTVNNVIDLENAFKYKTNNNLNYVVLGKGSNILFSKERYEDILFIKLSGDFDFFEINDSFANVGAAYPLKLAGKELIKNGYQDYIFFNLIPACIGGAIAQNAGTGPSEEMSDVCISVKVYDIKNKNILELSNESFNFDYRSSIVKKIPNRYVILSAKFDLRNQTSEIENLLKNMKTRISDKLNREPAGYTFGSTFMNSEKSAWKTVKAIKDRLKCNIDASYSDKHNNWIINKTAHGKEIASLVKKTQNLAKKELNIILKKEVTII